MSIRTVHIAANDNQVMLVRSEYLVWVDEHADWLETQVIGWNIWNVPMNSVRNYLWFMRFEYSFVSEGVRRRRESIEEVKND